MEILFLEPISPIVVYREVEKLDYGIERKGCLSNSSINNVIILSKKDGFINKELLSKKLLQC